MLFSRFFYIRSPHYLSFRNVSVFLLIILPIAITSLLIVFPILTLFYYATKNNFFALLPIANLYLSHTLVLFVGTGLATAILGTCAAALVSFYRFPGAKIMQWALFLPFSIPSYILAYRLQDFTDYSGPVQSTMRQLFATSWLPDLRSLSGLIILFTLGLYPYVYLLARASFKRQSATILDAAQLMGFSYWKALILTAIPLCWPAIAAGTSLVLLEVLNDYGAVSLSFVPTISIGIVDLWWSLGNQGAAAQLAIMALGFATLFYIAENLGRGNRRFYQIGRSKYQQKTPRYLHNLQGYLALGFCLLPIFLGFLLPIFLLISDSLAEITTQPHYLDALGNSLILASIAASLATCLGIVSSYILRHDYKIRYLVRLIQAGYALPGTLLAIGLTLGFAAFSLALSNLSQFFFSSEFSIYLFGSLAVLIFAYICRFSNIAISGIDSHMQKVSPSLDEVASTLGHKRPFILRSIHLPLIDSGILAAFLLVFIDVLKELPATLLLRPLNFDTLAVRVFEYASDERIEQAAPGALIIVLVGIFPVIYLSYLMDKMRS